MVFHVWEGGDRPSFVIPLKGSLYSSSQWRYSACSQGGLPPSIKARAYSVADCWRIVVKRGDVMSGRYLRNSLSPEAASSCWGVVVLSAMVC